MDPNIIIGIVIAKLIIIITSRAFYKKHKRDKDRKEKEKKLDSFSSDGSISP